ncbi:MAG: O-antigen ligase family protein [Kiritimatiellae bacterium]|nr:O-antigen ligase family protein [Kiritimatiellia bacterium]
MQKAIAKYGLAAHLSLLAVAPLFLFPFCEAPKIATAMLWLSLVGAWWIMLEPSLRGGEMLHDARRRVSLAIGRDPLFWVFLVVVAVAGLRALNTGIAMSYDFETRTWSVLQPAVSVFPGAFASSGALPFAATVALAVVVTGCRHALGSSARMAFLLMASSLSGAAAALLIFLASRGNAAASAVVAGNSGWFYHSGVAFALYLLCGTVSLFAAFERHWNAAVLLAVFSVGGNAAGMFVFSPALDAAVFAVATLLLFIAVFIVACRKLRGSGEFRMVVVYALVMVMGGLLVVAALPDGVVSARTAPFVSRDFLPSGLLDCRRVLSEAAFKSWTAHPWAGVGLGAFQFDLRFGVAAADWVLLPRGVAAVPNGWWQLLVEHGIVGTVVLALPFGLLMFTYFRRAAGCVRARRLPGPAVLAAPLALAALASTAFFDCSLLRADVIVVVGAILAVSAKSFPREMLRGNG